MRNCIITALFAILFYHGLGMVLKVAESMNQHAAGSSPIQYLRSTDEMSLESVTEANINTYTGFPASPEIFSASPSSRRSSPADANSAPRRKKKTRTPIDDIAREKDKRGGTEYKSERKEEIERVMGNNPQLTRIEAIGIADYLERIDNMDVTRHSGSKREMQLHFERKTAKEERLALKRKNGQAPPASPNPVVKSSKRKSKDITDYSEATKLGLLAIKENDPKQAMILFKKAYGLNKTLETCMNYGISLMRGNLLDEAEVKLMEANKIDEDRQRKGLPKSEEIYENLSALQGHLEHRTAYRAKVAEQNKQLAIKKRQEEDAVKKSKKEQMVRKAEEERELAAERKREAMKREEELKQLDLEYLATIGNLNSKTSVGASDKLGGGDGTIKKKRMMKKKKKAS